VVALQKWREGVVGFPYLGEGGGGTLTTSILRRDTLLVDYYVGKILAGRAVQNYGGHWVSGG
jgi:hypothetical protein